MILSWAAAANISTIAIIVLLITLLIKEENKNLSNVFLVSFLSVMGFVLLNEILLNLYTFPLFDILRLIGYSLPVLLYLYTLYLLGNFSSIRKKDFYHFIPFLIFTSFFVLFHLSQRTTEQQISQSYMFYQLMKYSGDIYRFIYLGLTFRIIQKSKAHLTENFSNDNIAQIEVLKKIIISWIILLVLYQIVIIGFRTQLYFIPFSTGILNTFNFLIILSIGVWGINNRKILPYSKEFINLEENIKTKYTNSGFNEAEKKSKADEIINQITMNEYYKNPDLSLTELSELLDINKHHLSEIINSEFEKNFFDFINQFRVDEFIRKLKNPKFNNYTIIALAYDSGFNSKSSFYRIFKNITGKTPSQFKKELLQSF